MEINKIIHGDVRSELKKLPDSCIDCCVTSPPYFGLRNYGHDDQLGLEETPELYVQHMVDVFLEVKRVLKKTGTLWLNLGDSYSSQGGGQVVNTKNSNRKGGSDTQNKGLPRKPQQGLKPKDLIGVPWMVAFALRESGWYLRQDLIWAKALTDSNQNYGTCMPESVTDRSVKSHEYIFLFSKSEKYYYDVESIKRVATDASNARTAQNLDQQTGSIRKKKMAI